MEIVAAVIVIALFLVFGVWVLSTVVIGVPYLGTPGKSARAVFSYLRTHCSIPFSEAVFVDLGSGLGNMVFAAEREGFRRVIGYECVAMYAWIAWIRAWIRRSRVTVRCARAEHADFAAVDVVYCFLNSSGIRAVEQHLFSRTRPGTWIVMLGCGSSLHTPADVVEMAPGIRLYVYRIP
ncbi:hypothetical protein HYV74_02935 [Candidatus Uhrbacteria bacterium]|nr:hypothetical protein [Candidatus Uhrbacteria bacterium]